MFTEWMPSSKILNVQLVSIPSEVDNSVTSRHFIARIKLTNQIEIA